MIYIFSICKRLGQNKEIFFTMIIIYSYLTLIFTGKKNVNKFRFITINQCNMHNWKIANKGVLDRKLQILTA